MNSRRSRTAGSSDAEIDARYGLEPVYEPGQGEPGAALGEFIEVQCPYCGESYGTSVDLTAGEQQYIEDCQVCCQPIELTIQLDEGGGLRALVAQRLDQA